MRRYHHMGIPTTEKRKDEVLVETHDYKFYSTPYNANKWHIQWHRFPEDHGLPKIVTEKPHIAFQVDNLEEEIENAHVIFGPYSPIPDYKVVMIEDNGALIELVETKLSDQELVEYEKKELGKYR